MTSGAIQTRLRWLPPVRARIVASCNCSTAHGAADRAALCGRRDLGTEVRDLADRVLCLGRKLSADLDRGLSEFHRHRSVIRSRGRDHRTRLRSHHALDLCVIPATAGWPPPTMRTKCVCDGLFGGRKHSLRAHGSFGTVPRGDLIRRSCAWCVGRCLRGRAEGPRSPQFVRDRGPSSGVRGGRNTLRMGKSPRTNG